MGQPRAHAARTRSGTVYRSASTASPRLDEILELLSVNDHGTLARRQATHVRGKLTWARLATLAVEALTPPLLRGHELTRVALLGARLQQRDAEKSARVTTETRDAILRLTNLAHSLRAATELADAAEPTEKRVYALLALHQRWWAADLSTQCW